MVTDHSAVAIGVTLPCIIKLLPATLHHTENRILNICVPQIVLQNSKYMEPNIYICPD